MASIWQVAEEFWSVVHPVLWYCIPAVPLVSRALISIRCGRFINDPIPEAAQERDLNRTTILALAGFSFTVAVGLSVLEPAERPNLQLSVWYVLVSCVSFLGAANLQSYKVTRLHNQFATGLVESGSLALLMTLLSLVFAAPFDKPFKWAAAALALLAWLADHVVTVRLDLQYLREKYRPPKGCTDDNSKEISSSQTPSSQTPSSQTSSSQTPSSQAPSSQAPSSQAPSSQTPSSQAASSQAASSQAASSQAASS